MGLDCGFDIYPRLEASPENIKGYVAFLGEVLATYKDEKILDYSKSRDKGVHEYVPLLKYCYAECFTFDVGEGPSMPRNPCHLNYFLRFSSKVSGPICCHAKPYIDSVYRIAQKHLGNRVYYWIEGGYNDNKKYSWDEVYAAGKELTTLVQLWS